MMRPGRGEEEEEEDEEAVVVGSIDVLHKALGCVIYWFLVKFTNEKELVTDRPTNRQTDQRIHPLLEMRGRI